MSSVPINSMADIFLGMPGYGRQTSAAGRGLWHSVRDSGRAVVKYTCGSLLAANFNILWTTALNMQRAGIPLKYFAMLHDDIGPQDWWLDTLIEEMESRDLDMLGAVAPIKDMNGLTTTALDNLEGNTWSQQRLTMREVFALPETFTSEDVGRPLLLNTGCWVCRFDPSWNNKVYFTINDRIVFDKRIDSYVVQVESEDWFFSRLCHERGLKLGATRKVAIAHEGYAKFGNELPWGDWEHDKDFIESRAHRTNDAPAAEKIDGFRFPHDVDGWLSPIEGEKLAALASGKRVLEIGSYCGRSTICLAQTAKDVVSVDPHDGRGTPQPRDTYDEFRANLERYNLNQNVSVNQCTLDELLGWMKPPGRLDRSFDLIFIDGAHDYANVTRDIDRALTVLAPGGLLAFHDYQSIDHPGVTKAVDEFISTGATLLSKNDALAVIRPPAADMTPVLTPAAEQPPALVSSEV
jgi:predicted O-methyltransferase YrrM